MKIDIKSDLKQASINIKAVQSGVPKAIAAALNRVSEGLKTEAARIVRKKYNIRAGDVRERGNIKVTRANMSRLEILLTSTGRNIPLIRFSTTPNSPRSVKVVKAAVKRSGKKPIPGAFVAQMRSGHIGVFQRSGRTRTPIQEKYGPAVPVMLNEPGVSEHLNEEAGKRMEKRLDHEMDRVLGRLKIK